jgi:ABC-type dipeptide/oligopeptide/nickel transport system ATPase component
MFPPVSTLSGERRSKVSHTGSEWSRWDLHVHTPSSHTHHFGTEDDATWDRYIQDLEALPANVAVLGINDYLTVDGYERLRRAKEEEQRLPNIKLLLPVIELRLKMFGGQGKWIRVNYHVIFSDTVPADAIRNQFLAKLNSSYEMKGHKWSGAPLPEQMGKFAEVIRASATDPSSKPDFALAAAYYNVDVDQVRQVLTESSDFAGNYVVALGKAEWDALRWEGSAAEKLTLIERADFLFTACGTEAEFRSGQQKLHNETGNGRLLHCSDAHYLSSSTEPNRIGHCMTWVKAYPSFEGLLLARHEYEGRVYVGPSPEQHKHVEANPTKYLRSVKISSPSLSTRAWFGGEELRLNPGLVAIIGNKGTGKSALTDAIALVADAKVEEHMSFLRDDRFRHQRLGLADKHKCEIVWRSGDPEERVLSEHVEKHKPERVRYLPQSYFERLCSEIGQNAQDEFEKQLKQVVFTWLPNDRRMGTDSLDDLIRVTTGQWRERHRLRTIELRQLNERIAMLERQLQPDTVQDVRSQLKERQRELTAHESRKPPDAPADPVAGAGTPDEQLAKITLLESRISEIDATIEANTTALTALRKRRQDLDDVESKINNVRTYFESQLRTVAVSTVLQQESLTLDGIVQLTINRQPLIQTVGNLETQIESFSSQTSDLAGERDDLRLKRQALLNELDEERRAHREAQEAVQRWQAQRDAIVGAPDLEGTVAHLEAALEAMPYATAVLAEALRARDELTGDMFADLAQLRNSYSELFGPIQQYLEAEELLGEGLTMRVDALIRQDGFAQQFLEMIDRTKRGAFFQRSEEDLNPRLAAVDFGDEASLKEFITTIVKELIPYDQDGRPAGDLDWQLKSRLDRASLYDFIFGLDYLQPHYALTFNDKQIAQLSPGERGAALLIFYLLVDKSELPILLDQPEENLDNATVSRLLVPAIRKARNRRQVILVTHNPNLAVYCDADQVVYCDIVRTPGTRITYHAGPLEHVQTRRWVIDVLEGTGRAFGKRHDKYGIGPHGELVLKGE